MLSFAPKFKTPGEVYDLLCGEFALAPINTKQHHKDASKVFRELSIKVLSEELSKVEETQVNAYLAVLSDLIAAFEKYTAPKMKGADLLKHLLESNGLKQSDLEGIATQSNISAIINGTRPIGWEVAVKLGSRFGLEPVVFMK